MRKSVIAIASTFATVAAVLGYGYWQCLMTGSLMISLGDLARATPNRIYGDVDRAVITLKDAAGNAIGAGYVEPPLTYIRWRYPGYVECQKAEKEGPFNPERSDYWYRQCAPVLLRWYSQVGDAARSFDVRWGACTVTDAPLQLRVSRNGWMTWWIPLPHIGGPAMTTYWAIIVLDSRDCSVRQRK